MMKIQQEEGEQQQQPKQFIFPLPLGTHPAVALYAPILAESNMNTNNGDVNSNSNTPSSILDVLYQQYHQYKQEQQQHSNLPFSLLSSSTTTNTSSSLLFNLYNN
eukprot:UN10666